MTYGPKQVVGIANAEARAGFFGTKKPTFGENWGAVNLGFRGWTLNDVYTCTYSEVLHRVPLVPSLKVTFTME